MDSYTLHSFYKMIQYFENLYIQECIKASMDGHIAKPITMELLKEKLAK